MNRAFNGKEGLSRGASRQIERSLAIGHLSREREREREREEGGRITSAKVGHLWHARETFPVRSAEMR